MTIEIPKLTDNTRIFGFHIEQNEDMWGAEIVPHVQDGYFFVGVFDPTHQVTYTKRGVIGSAVPLTLQAYGFNFSDVNWTIEPSSKHDTPPYEPTKRIKGESVDLDGLEKQLELDIIKTLDSNCSSQVHCSVGIADIVTDTSIIEVKYSLTRTHLFQAIGQVLSYRQAINPALIPIVIGYRSSENIEGIIEAAKDMGVSVICWGEV